MFKTKYALAALFLLGLCWQADAATCFWVGGTATFSSANAASWASSTGGTASSCAATSGVPINNGDVATIDANSGNGTITVSGNLNTSTGFGITMSGGTSTLDFSANNNSPTLTSLLITAGTINLGSGTFTIGGACSNGGASANFTGATVSAGTSTLAMVMTGSGHGNNIFTGGGKTFATVTFTGEATGGCGWGVSANNNTFGHLTLTGPVLISFPAGQTQTISNAFTWTGTSTNPVVISGTLSTATAATFVNPTASTGTWIVTSNIIYSASNNPTFTNCLNGSGNSNVSCTAPNVVAGGGGGLIGGGF